MKYFTWELLKTYDSEGENKWESNCKKYYSEYLEIKKYLPEQLIKQYESDGFHDAIITDISITSDKNRKKPTCTVSISLCKMWGDTVWYRGMLEYKDVSVFHMDMPYLRPGNSVGEYLYGEFYFEKNKGFTHNFIFTDNSEIFIECRKINWNEIERNCVD